MTALEALKAATAHADTAVHYAEQALIVARKAVPVAKHMIAAAEADAAGQTEQADQAKAAVVQAASDAIDAPGPPDFPMIAKPFQPMILAGAIGLILMLLKPKPDFTAGSGSSRTE